MTKTFIARDTTLGDTFEGNYAATEGGIIEWIRQLTEATAAEIESLWTVSPGITEKIVYHVNIGKLNWADDRLTAADWITRLKIGITGDGLVMLEEVHIRRVSSDGLTIRASIDLTGFSEALVANALLEHSSLADTTLDNPIGAAADDHLVIIFVATNTATHGSDRFVDVEQNLTESTRILAPLDDGAPPSGFVYNQGIII